MAISAVDITYHMHIVAERRTIWNLAKRETPPDPELCFRFGRCGLATAVLGVGCGRRGADDEEEREDEDVGVFPRVFFAMVMAW